MESRFALVNLPLAPNRMTNQTSSKSNSVQASQLRCIGCDRVFDKAAQNFRCASCGDLLEVVYPDWNTSDATRLDAAKLRALWRQRRTSGLPADESGVWRFRELLPSFDEKDVISLREGNTPLYEMPGCARIARLPQLYAKHQGMNPTGSFKDTGMTVAASVARRARGEGGQGLDRCRARSADPVSLPA